MKCPNCGASIQLDNSRESGFCSYCGSKVQIKKEQPKTIKIDRSEDIPNYLSLARTAAEASNGVEVLSYANAILEIDAQNAEAWFLKMQGQSMISSFLDFGNEIFVSAKKALEFDSSDEMKLSVYQHLLMCCINCLASCKAYLQDTANIEAVYNANYSINPFDASSQTLAVDDMLNFVLAAEPNILELRWFVPDDEIAKSADLQKLVTDIAVQWKYYQRAINDRLHVYGNHMNDNYLEQCKSNLRRIKQGLPNQDVVKEDSMTNESASFQYWPVIIGVIIIILWIIATRG